MRITELFTAQSIALDEAAADQAQIIDRLVESGADLLSGKNVLGSMELKPYDACAIEEKVK